MATLPKAAQRQLEQADAIQASLQAPPAQATIVTDASQLIAPPAPEPAPAPAPTPAPTPAAPAPATEDITYWRNKAKTVEGMLRAQVPELQTRNTMLEAQVAQLQGEMQTLKTAASRPPAEPAKPTVDPRDVEQFGSDMMDMVQRYVTNAVAAIESKTASMTSDLTSRIQALEGSVQRVGQRADDSLESQFWAQLKQLVPDYETVNADEGWTAWLAETDQLTGLRRQDALLAAQRTLDARRVANIFNLYKASVPPPPSAALASQVSPSGGGSSAAPIAPAAPVVISQKFINDFYRDVARGKYVGREADARSIEVQIHQAASEGRVTN